MEEHLDYVRALARGIHQSLPTKVEYEELVQLGAVGLAEACHAFDAARGVAFRTFAYHRIRGAIFDGLGQMCGSAHAALRRHLIRESALNTVSAEESSAPAADPQRVRATQRVALVVLLSDLSAGDAPPDSSTLPPDESVSRRELCARVRQTLALLPTLECAVLRLHYFDGLSLTQCAHRLGRHKAWISRLHARGLDLLRERLTAPAELRRIRNSA